MPYHTAQGSKYERKYELLECVSIIQCEDCMRANGYHKYELLACVSIIQRKGCMGATEYRKYELLACVSIHSTREQV